MILLVGIMLALIVMASHPATVPLAMLTGFILGLSVMGQIWVSVGKSERPK